MGEWIVDGEHRKRNRIVVIANRFAQSAPGPARDAIEEETAFNPTAQQSTFCEHRSRRSDQGNDDVGSAREHASDRYVAIRATINKRFVSKRVQVALPSEQRNAAKVLDGITARITGARELSIHS